MPYPVHYYHRYSVCATISYAAFMIACIAATATALFTNYWSVAKTGFGFTERTFNQGLMPWTCPQGGNCDRWWDYEPTWHHAVLIMMGISLIIEILALFWSFLAICPCCCKRYINHPLSLFALVPTLLLTASLVVYGINNNDLYQDPNFSMGLKTDLGWSFWVTVGAAAVALIDVFVGAMAAHANDRAI